MQVHEEYSPRDPYFAPYLYFRQRVVSLHSHVVLFLQCDSDVCQPHEETNPGNHNQQRERRFVDAGTQVELETALLACPLRLLSNDPVAQNASTMDNAVADDEEVDETDYPLIDGLPPRLRRGGRRASSSTSGTSQVQQNTSPFQGPVSTGSGPMPDQPRMPHEVPGHLLSEYSTLMDALKDPSQHK